eukprot:UN11793
MWKDLNLTKISFLENKKKLSKKFSDQKIVFVEFFVFWFDFFYFIFYYFQEKILCKLKLRISTL